MYQTASFEEKIEIINEYKLSLENLNKQNIQNLQKQQNDLRGEKEITNVEEHKLVKDGIVIKEEIEPYLSNYELLNTLGECSNLANEENIFLVKKLFENARNFYPDNSLQGLKELMELPYKKAIDLLGDNILELLNNKQISM
ncbi:hypothetical protein RAS_09300 [Rickettsia asiatica]|uniref:Uncharacterized protein n=1 Tax=Rickettsia asiatica TaxID=238800 RepID=A0A510GJ26_9RICK|nr:hypothetical protein [Rickettsia asiatica]BBJ31821.1 hypothetical protein RAS_09300 [Rickettsia asiatica]